MSDWISIKDELPPYDEDVLLYSFNEGVIAGFRTLSSDDGETDVWFSQGGCQDMTPPDFNWTHWMPLPAAPTDNDQGEA